MLLCIFIHRTIAPFTSGRKGGGGGLPFGLLHSTQSYELTEDLQKLLPHPPPLVSPPLQLHLSLNPGFCYSFCLRSCAQKPFCVTIAVLRFLLRLFLHPEAILYAILLYCGTVVYISELYVLWISFLADLTTLSVFQDVGS